MKSYSKVIEKFFEAGWVKKKENDYYLFLEKNGALLKIALKTDKIVSRDDGDYNLDRTIEVIASITGLSEISKSSKVIDLARKADMGAGDFLNVVCEKLSLKIVNTSMPKTVDDIILA